MRPFVLPSLRFLLPPALMAVSLGLMPLAGQDGAEPPKQQPTSNPTGSKAAEKLAEAARTRIKKVSATDYTLGPIKFSSATREVRVPAAVNMTEGILEYALVHENGKTHESLLKTAVSPTEFNVALLLCHYEPHIKDAARFAEEDLLPETRAKMAQPMQNEGANRVLLTLEWKDKDGAAKTAPLSAWVRDRKEQKPMSTDHWSYTGSFVSQSGFAAEDDGSHIAIYFDLVALLNLPDPGNRSDDRWHVETAAVPPVDTPVTLVISHLPAPEKASAAK
jgi:hypothetical protein